MPVNLFMDNPRTFKELGKDFLKKMRPDMSTLFTAAMDDSNFAPHRKRLFMQDATSLVNAHLKAHHEESKNKNKSLRLKSKVNIIKKMPPRRTKRKARKPRIRRSLNSVPFPKTRLVELKSVFQGSMDPGSAGGISIGSFNLNNPLDPFDLADSVSTTISKTEAHPKYWSAYESIYERFEVVGYKIKMRFLNASGTFSTAIVLVPANNIHATEVKSILGDTVTFATRMKEAHPEATVRYMASSTAENTFNVVLSRKGNIRKMAPQDDRMNGNLVGKTLISDTQAGPAAIQKLYFAYGTVNSASIDLTAIVWVAELSQMVLFSGLPDLEGAAVA